MAILYFIFKQGPMILHKKIQVISSKNEGVTLIFKIQNQIKIGKNCCHTFIFAQNNLKFFVLSLRTIPQKKII